MPKRNPYVPRHCDAPSDSNPTRPRARRVLAAAGVATAVTGAVVAAGVLAGVPNLSPAAAGDIAGAKEKAAAAVLAQRTQAVSRSSDDRRAQADLLKTHALSGAVGPATTQTTNDKPTDPRQLAEMLMPQYGLSSSEFSCLDALWNKESGWNYQATNPSSGAYGIPQSLPGSKMGLIASDWATNPETQIRWGLTYIRNDYGSACAAWGHSQSTGWY